MSQGKYKFLDLFKLDGEMAIITGGMGMLGTEYSETLLDAGAKVGIFDISITNLNEKLKELKKGGNLYFYQVDITNKNSVIDALEKAKKEIGIPTILINNAGIDVPPYSSLEENKYFENYSEESWEKVVDSHLKGMFFCCQVIGGCMAKNKGGSIINISSTYGIVSPDQRIYEYRPEGFVKPISYSVAKSGVLNLTRYLATYWAKKKVRVNTLTLGGVLNNQDSQFVKNYSERTPLGRMANRDEYNGAILFLASKASSYMTGANLIIDGGWTAW